ncbi:hypothetical protein HYFRA_00008846 [Hymenoscyphus fraxineus]|uniref:Uncharacterized protein n=1 Tax=Hymenoscyphus fraxineus TaxID=746836 RepID=A0A9N9KX55_9HELO|nr:hypothetical protein HYFRA_00008846 [Hymenoscyphus fraxineus]
MPPSPKKDEKPATELSPPIPTPKDNPAKAIHQDIKTCLIALGAHEEYAQFIADQVVPGGETYLEDVYIRTVHNEDESETTEMRIRAVTYDPASRTFYFFIGCFFVVVASFFVAAFVKALCVLRS